MVKSASFAKPENRSSPLINKQRLTKKRGTLPKEQIKTLKTNVEVVLDI